MIRKMNITAINPSTGMEKINLMTLKIATIRNTTKAIPSKNSNAVKIISITP